MFTIAKNQLTFSHHLFEIIITTIQYLTYVTDEVRVKTKALERCREKLVSTIDDIKDISQEFEIERQDYLNTIRRQDQTVQLYDQLLSTVVPLLRRDCNYFNMDKIKVESKWDKDIGNWILPKLVTSKTMLVHTELPKATGKGTQRVKTPSARGSCSSSQGSKVRSRRASSIAGKAPVALQEDKYLSYLQGADDSSEYFKPKRAREILSESHHVPKESTPGHANKRVTSKTSLDSDSGLPNAAAVHRVDAKYVGSIRSGKRLQSLARSSIQIIEASQEKDLETLDTKKKKQHILKPLSNAKLNKLSN